MPPRYLLTQAQSFLPTCACRIPAVLPAFPLRTQARFASLLGDLQNVPTSYSKAIRLGRGPSSGKGKTSGRGHKGQKQHGKVPAGFTGGQTKLEVTNPTRGKDNENFSSDLAPLNIDRIQEWIDQGRIDPSKPITIRELYRSRCVNRIGEGIKLLGRNSTALRSPIHITVSRASSSAIAAVERAGGTVTTRYYTEFSVKKILAGLMHPTISLRSHPTTQPFELPFASGTSFPIRDQSLLALPRTSNEGEIFKYRLPDPIRRKDQEYYRDAAHRGYLQHEVAEGEGPSLFFRPRPEGIPVARTKKVKKVDENKLW
ncbi:50S ribosomal subunit protein L15 [Eremomyces bilateralis CBS 781.70]|uniref:50S ribosomal subunit protein L15 n=1 Tax=Eremomyces bilateralis CBS 781.70 TaxID=1392243 RepID=A0A6G1GB14_9PEZI|nr:50S ribosomal subunit protein L15 [Eremomyces bilateralis CBS 781.70]KAF1815278.1 50S ribosomal subunit protein L15 [Eremomyces bilateralis CBS 781.70]